MMIVCALTSLGDRAAHLTLTVPLSIKLCFLVPVQTYVVKLQPLPERLVGVLRLTSIYILWLTFGIDCVQFELLECHTK